MASDAAHKYIREQLKALGNPAGDSENYAIIRDIVDSALGWMDGPQIVAYLNSPTGDYIDGATTIAQKVAGYEAQKKATEESTRVAKAVSEAQVKTAARSLSGATESGFITPSAQHQDNQPQQGTNDVVSVLGKAGYKWSPLNKPGAGGDSALWVGPDGRTVTEADAIIAAANAGTPVNNVIRWMMATYGMTQQEAQDQYFANQAAYNDDYRQANRIGASAAAAAPVARYGFQEYGGRVYRTNDLSPLLEDTGITAPGFTNIQVQPTTGDLTGIDAQGNFKVIAPKYGFASVDPRVVFGEGVRQFDVGEAGTNARSAADRAAANQRAALSAQTLGFQTVAGLAPNLGQLALDIAKFQRDVTTTPADFLYRAFTSRGGTSPLPQVTGADFINSIANEIAKYNQVLQSYNAQPVGFAQPAAAPAAATAAAPTGFAGAPTTFTAPEGAPVSAEEGLARFRALNPGFAMPQPAAQPTFDPMANGGQGGWSVGGAPVSLLDASGNLSLPASVATVASPAAAVAPPAPTFTQAPPAPAPVGFQMPSIPAPKQTTQAELKSLEQQYRPPAITSILEGKMPAPLDLGFSLPTPQQYGALTPDERSAFSTTLATQYNVSPQDFEYAVQKRFRAPAERRAKVVGF